MQAFHTFLHRFWNDESGVIVSAELVLIATLCVLPMIVGLSELSSAINHELRDVASSFLSSNQSSSQASGNWNGENNATQRDIGGYNQ